VQLWSNPASWRVVETPSPLPVSVNIQWCSSASWKLISECQRGWLLTKRSHHMPQGSKPYWFSCHQTANMWTLFSLRDMRKLETNDGLRHVSIMICTRIIATLPEFMIPAGLNLYRETNITFLIHFCTEFPKLHNPTILCSFGNSVQNYIIQQYYSFRNIFPFPCLCHYKFMVFVTMQSVP
jgi:hypothetical protein